MSPFVLEFYPFDEMFLSLYGALRLSDQDDGSKRYRAAVFPSMEHAASWSEGMEPRPFVTGTLESGHVVVVQEDAE